MNLFTKPMRLLTAVVLQQRSDQVVKALLQLGVLDFIHISRLEADQLAKLSSKPSTTNRVVLEDLRGRVEALLKQGHLALPGESTLDVSLLAEPQVDAYRAVLDELTQTLLALKERQKVANQALLGVEEMRRYLAESKWQYLDLRVGSVKEGKSEQLEEKLSPYGAFVEPIDEEFVTVLSLRRDLAQIDPLLDKFGWTEESDPLLQKQAVVLVRTRLETEHQKLIDKRGEIEQSVKRAIAERKEELHAIWSNLRLNELSDQIKSYFSYTRNTTLFSGWVPADQAESVRNAIVEASGGQCVVEWTEATEVPRESVPVAVTSPKVLEPFQNMVNNYATPEYGTVNPTIFVMIAYLSMFGLMFGDVGQGLVLLLVGLFGSRSYRRNPEKKEGLLTRNVTNLLVYLGLSSMLFGALFGSYFGLPLLPPLWFNFEAAVEGHAPATALVRDVYGILGITIRFGIIIIYTGLVLNWVNLFRKKSFVPMLLDKNGVVGGVLFGTGIYMAFGFVGSSYRSFPSDPWIIPTLVICLILLFAKPYVQHFVDLKQGRTDKTFGQVAAGSIMEFLVDVLEIFTGYLSNTLSFMRVAGLGIAHASLMGTFKYLQSMVGGVAGVLIFIAGNLLVIVLEGLSAGIQSLRLNYYEFFSRYFTGRGIAYRPVGLKRSSSDNR
ncbi:MAG TPA: V-type ATPase 116kDa subunit family protein [Sphaerochaeta sp.]|jgi:V/A-type H+-transporting ATPase subunit I|nr:V-type ATPase 116kDa subunit family protein [Sphaerochaeta sp.]HQB05849.1 V-type ATPase 116kDa subunit family protein [Sphaerochaeta sp.]